MPLHDKNSVRDNLEDDIYASGNLSVSMPKYRFPDLGMIREPPTRSCTMN